uniref:Uncharacterized protein n=1 Tax=Acanthochromis polyacanthus TaxID=80966 RepID=A0A3Q1FYC7_9TELE
MATQGGVAFQEKVSRLLSRQNGKPVLKPSRALALGDSVSNRNLKNRDQTNRSDYSGRLRCRARTNHTNGSEYSALDPLQAALKNKSGQSNLQGGRLPSKQATVLLKRFPNQRYEI